MNYRVSKREPRTKKEKRDNFSLYLKIKIGVMQARQEELPFFTLVTCKVIVMARITTGKNHHPDQPSSPLLSVKQAGKSIPTFHVLPSPFLSYFHK